MKITKYINPNWTEYRNEIGQLHREDGPSLEYNYGRKEWYQNGQLHRSNGPAIEEDSRFERWFFNGNPNRFRSEYDLSFVFRFSIKNKKQFILDNIVGIDPGEAFLLQLTIKNHFPEHLDYLNKLLALQ